MKLPRFSCRLRPAVVMVVLGALPAEMVPAARTILVDQGVAATALVPSVANGGSALGTGDWTTVGSPPNAANWVEGVTGLGYDTQPTYGPLIGIDVLAAMSGVNQSAYLRVPFVISDQSTLDAVRSLVLRMRYDDGFVAYLNGTRIASANAPAALPWNAGASGDHPDAAAQVFEDFDVTAFVSSLQVGANLLAIHGLNNGTTSSDFLIVPQLVAGDVLVEWPEFRLTLVTGGLTRPTGMAHAGDGSGRLFVLEQAGTIRIVEDGQLLPAPFLNIGGRVMNGGEQGLLGIAFPPGYAEKGYFYVNYISKVAGRSGDTVVSRFSLDANAADPVRTADPNSEEILLVVDQPYSNHNAGQMNFGDDGYLYISFGDGGDAGDPAERAQDPLELLGKMLRIDTEGLPDPGKPYAVPPTNPFVGNPSVRAEIWAVGLRNPWRWSFDRANGDLWIADVGQGAYEEVHWVPGTSEGGENYGWDFYEGLHLTTYNPAAPPAPETLTQPVFEYGRGLGTSITGGYVYRGARHPRMRGIYYVGDYNSGRIWGVQPDGEGGWVSLQFEDTVFRPSCFGEDESGELYFGHLQGGVIYSIGDTRDASYLEVLDFSVDGQGAVSVSFGAEIGATFQLQVSENLADWDDVGEPLVADSLVESLGGTLGDPLPGRAFVRVARLD